MISSLLTCSIVSSADLPSDLLYSDPFESLSPSSNVQSHLPHSASPFKFSSSIHQTVREGTTSSRSKLHATGMARSWNMPGDTETPIIPLEVFNRHPSLRSPFVCTSVHFFPKVSFHRACELHGILPLFTYPNRKPWSASMSKSHILNVYSLCSAVSRICLWMQPSTSLSSW